MRVLETRAFVANKGVLENNKRDSPRKMLLCVVFRLEVGEVELVRLRDVDEQEEEDDGHPNGDPYVDVQE